MRKSLLPVVVALAVCLAGLAPVSTASAATDITIDVETEDITLRQGRCGSVNIWAYGDWDTFLTDTVTIVVRRPSGRRHDRIVVHDSYGWVDEYTRVCYAQPAGRYTVEVTVVATDEFGDDHVATDTTAFRVTKVKPKARSRIAERHGRIHGEGKWKFAVVGTLLRAGQKYAGRRVWLVARIGGLWIKIDRSVTGRRGDRRGRVGWVFKPNRFKWALWFAGNSTTRPALSDSFRFPSASRTSARFAARVSDARSVIEQR
jgi:hypothetical protein